MKAKFNKKDLLTTLTMARNAIPAKTVNPILENFLFTAREGVFVITASDLETTIISCIESNEEKGNSVGEEGVACVPARFIIDIIRQISDENLSIEQEGEGPMTIRWSNGRSVIPCMTSEDYPAVFRSVVDGTTMTFPTKELYEAINDTSYACLTDDSLRPALCGIFFEINPEEINLVGTDSHRLVIRKMKGCTASKKDSFILKTKDASLIGMACLESESVKAEYDEGHAVFYFGQTTIQVNTVSGKYPNYRQAVPTRNGNVLVADRKLLLSAIRRVTVCANKASNLVRMSFTPDITGATMEISAEDLGYSVAAKERFETDYAGEKLVIGFKSAFLTEILGKLNCESVRIAFADPRRATLITPEKEEKEEGEKVEEPDTRVVLMPIALG